MRIYPEFPLQQEIKYEADIILGHPSSPCGLPLMSSRRASLASAANSGITSSLSVISPETPNSHGSQMSFEPLIQGTQLSGVTSDPTFSDPIYLDSNCIDYGIPFDDNSNIPQRQSYSWDVSTGFDCLGVPLDLPPAVNDSHLTTEIYDAANSMQQEMSFLPTTTTSLGLQSLQVDTTMVEDMQHSVDAHLTSPLSYDIYLYSQPDPLQAFAQQNLNHEHDPTNGYSMCCTRSSSPTIKTDIAGRKSSKNKSASVTRTRDHTGSLSAKAKHQSRRQKKERIRVAVAEKSKYECPWYESGKKCDHRFPRCEHRTRHLKNHIFKNIVILTGKGTGGRKKAKEKEQPKRAEDPAFWEPLLPYLHMDEGRVTRAIWRVVQHGLKIPDNILKKLHEKLPSLDLNGPAPSIDDDRADCYCRFCDTYYSRPDNYKQHMFTVHFLTPPKFNGRKPRLFSTTGVFDLEAIEEAGILDFYQDFQRKQAEEERRRLELGLDPVLPPPPPPPPRRRNTGSRQRGKIKQTRQASCEQTPSDLFGQD